MKKISLEELTTLAEKATGKISKIYLHWTAGNYHQFFIDYHLLIDDDGSIIASTDDLSERKCHTHMRNSKALAIAMCCGNNAIAYADGSVDFGSAPPTSRQIDTMARVVALLCKQLNLPISADIVITHCEAAEEDGYGPSTTCERWDLWKLPDLPGDGQIKGGGDVIRGKALWYHGGDCHC